MSVEIIWNSLNVGQWEEKFQLVPHSNILQSYNYAKAYCPYARQRARWGLIKIDDAEAGLIQVFEAGILWNALHAVMVDRGPLWFSGYGNAMHIKRVFDELNRQFPKRLGRRRRILPEVEDGVSIQKMLGQLGFERLDREPYQTYWVDLQKDEEGLRAGLHQKWRNSLNKAERSDLKVEWDVKGVHAPWMLGIYATDKSLRGYGGASPEFLKLYLPHVISAGDFYLGRAVKNGVPIAFVLLIKHGRSATYLAGWSGDEGRENSAHNLLLWNSLKLLKDHHVKDFDLGGVNDGDAQGIKDFKEGLGGRFVRCVGHYM